MPSLRLVRLFCIGRALCHDELDSGLAVLPAEERLTIGSPEGLQEFRDFQLLYILLYLGIPPERQPIFTLTLHRTTNYVAVAAGLLAVVLELPRLWRQHTVTALLVPLSFFAP